MKISLATALGTCFGVQDAIDAAMDESFRDNLTIFGELVHNPQVIEELRARGVRIVKSLDETIPTPNVMITAHGAPASLRTKLEARGLRVYDASCPLVLKVHNKVAALVRDGYFPVVIGQRDHVEVRGIVGDLREYDVISNASEVDRLAGRERIGIVCQTTQQLEVARDLVAAISTRFPAAEVKFIDTICKPTKDRQAAVRELAEQVDLMIVVGGQNSANTKKLKKVCDDRGLEAYHIVRPEELDPAWFCGKQHIGITAGTSTPPYVIQQVYEAIDRIAAGTHS
ncbi:MAG: 4-hydroxy-3-methylbut-2-enyl diphosphate reductase [Planctomycetota bacterium]